MPTKQTAVEALDLSQFEGHTPGPWVYDNIPGMDRHGFPAHLHRIASRENIPVVGLDCRKAEDQADAKLIAAAPALLSECRRQRDVIAARDAEVKRLREALVYIVAAQNKPFDHADRRASVEQARAALSGEGA